MSICTIERIAVTETRGGDPLTAFLDIHYGEEPETTKITPTIQKDGEA